jgi:hypothetical protein
VFHDPQSTFGLVMLVLTCVGSTLRGWQVALRPNRPFAEWREGGHDR